MTGSWLRPLPQGFEPPFPALRNDSNSPHPFERAQSTESNPAHGLFSDAEDIPSEVSSTDADGERNESARESPYADKGKSVSRTTVAAASPDHGRKRQTHLEAKVNPKRVCTVSSRERSVRELSAPWNNQMGQGTDPSLDPEVWHLSHNHRANDRESVEKEQAFSSDPSRSRSRYFRCAVCDVPRPIRFWDSGICAYCIEFPAQYCVQGDHEADQSCFIDAKGNLHEVCNKCRGQPFSM